MPSDFVLPPDPKLGDLSLPCFAVAKELGLNPGEMAKKIADSLTSASAVKCQAAGPYLNITFDMVFVGAVIQEINKQPNEYGSNSSGKKQRVMLEFANQNTHKELHIGHLRNIAYGDAVTRILTANGYRAVPVSYINDFGIHVAKTLWWLTHPANPEAQLALTGEIANKGFFLGSQYAESVVQLGDNSEKKIEVGQVMKALESRRGEIYELWKKTRQWNIDQFAELYSELGISLETTFYESDYIEEGMVLVKKLLAKGILEESQGAVIADLEKYGLGILVVLRSDGTALYPVADLPLTIYKVKKYKLHTSLWVVDVRQGQYFHQLFKVLEATGLKAELAHLPYEFVKLPSGMMSSRSGNVIRYEEIRNQAVIKARQEIASRHADWDDKRIESVARIIAYGALKFEMVKIDAQKVITFDVDTALRFDGYTAAYLQYTYARIKSLVRKSKIVKNKALIELLTNDRERKLALMLARFPEIIRTAGETHQPADVAKYLFELGQLFNDYYHGVSILSNDEENQNLIAARLLLVETVAGVLKRGLALLGIETVEEM